MSKLPSIGSPNESLSPKKSMFESTIIEAEVEHETPFDTTLNELSLIDFPHPEENSSMKNRITTLESNNEKQINFNKLTLETFNNLNANVHNLEDHIRLLLGKLQESYDEKLNNLKKEFDHRFELQLNENKRLQNHIASLKSDNNLIKTKLNNAVTKLNILQKEFGDEDIPEDDLVLTMNSTMSASVSRPQTTTF